MVNIDCFVCLFVLLLFFISLTLYVNSLIIIKHVNNKAASNDIGDTLLVKGRERIYFKVYQIIVKN